MNSHLSSCDSSANQEESQSFSLLDERIRRWIWEQQWTELRDVQEKAIQPILSGDTDVIMSSPTASGKTEAAFLPILTRILQSPAVDSIDSVYISPLKALINDQFDRLDLLCEHLNVSVSRWHGDVSQSKKKLVLEDPKGILLITPESLESLFVNHGTAIPRLFSGIKFIVIDELHSFIGSERGRQLQSLLRRLDLSINKTVPRIALSATLGDMPSVSLYLRPDKKLPCAIIQSNLNQQEIKIQVRGYHSKQILSVKSQSNESENSDYSEEGGGDRFEIAGDLYRTLRGDSNLIFANRRTEVEIYADILRRMCEENCVPNEFWPHHGSLSKDLREDVEATIKDKSRPATVVCTTTLEMGIDIGAVCSIAQVGSPPSVASLRQRLGRSGRRGQPAVIRIYIQENEINTDTPPQDRLRSDLFQTTAMIELLTRGWYEPPSDTKLHLSTLVQQILSLIAQYGGILALTAWEILCNSGPFKAVDKSTFARLLRSLASFDILMQDSEGLLLPGKKGERIVNHYSFYTAFITPEEYKLVTQEGRSIGSLPINYPLVPGVFIIFAGKRWEVVDVEIGHKIVILKPSKGGRPPKFGGAIKSIHDKIRQEMFSIYSSTIIPPYLNPCARDLFLEGRAYFKQMELNKRRIIEYSGGALVFPWRGDQVMNTLAVGMIADGYKVSMEGVALNVLNVNRDDVVDYFLNLSSKKTRSSLELASTIPNKVEEKYDQFLTEDLLDINYVSSHLSVIDTAEIIKEIVSLHLR
ncbi:MAG: DEAD/DEAH box helicase [Ignavibacteriae bacterium]|nr:MAG: DEAD/DEAH box helicase [Ignavibacteriota bacterium]